MSGYEEAFKQIALNSIKLNKPEERDYYDKDGNLICGNCNTPRSEFKEFFGEMHFLPIPCKCRIEAEERKKHLDRVKRLKKNSGIPSKYSNASFDTLAPDPENSRSVKILKRYAEKFPELYLKNQGLIIHGGVGTGKTHISACAANAIMDQGYSVLFVSLSELLQKKKSFDHWWEEEEFLDKIKQKKLLIIDDLGTERDTSFAIEFIYNVVNTRCNAGKPFIVTTNISFNDMIECKDLQYARIYNRLIESCAYPVEFTGESKRISIAADKYDNMSKLLEDEDEN